MITPCKYAGDSSDEFCVSCNGLTIKDYNQKEVSADKCGGYKPKEDTPTIQTILNEPKVEDVSTSLSETVEPTLTEEVDKLPTSKPKFDTKATTKEITITSSISKEIKGSWYKVSYAETIELPTDADVEMERERLWNICNNEVDKQIENLL